MNKSKYRCESGHEMVMYGEYSALEIHPGDGVRPRSYNFCMECWGAWAVAQWPMKKVEDELSPDLKVQQQPTVLD
jgi:hypothetical protein